MSKKSMQMMHANAVKGTMNGKPVAASEHFVVYQQLNPLHIRAL